MNNDGTTSASYNWVDVEGRGNAAADKVDTNSTFNLANNGADGTNNYAFVVTNYSVTSGTPESTPGAGDEQTNWQTNDGDVLLNNFGTNDLLYIDNHGHNDVTSQVTWLSGAGPIIDDPTLTPGAESLSFSLPNNPDDATNGNYGAFVHFTLVAGYPVAPFYFDVNAAAAQHMLVVG
jgi:hypothetical protein